MSFECSTPSSFLENLSFASSACWGAGLMRFNPRSESGALFQKAACMAGNSRVHMCREGPLERPREGEFVFKLVWLSYRPSAAHRCCWLCRARAAALRLTVIQRQQERDYGSWLSHRVRWEEENNSLIYLGRWMVSSLSATTGCEQHQLQLLGMGFAQADVPSPHPPARAAPGWTHRAEAPAPTAVASRASRGAQEGSSWDSHSAHGLVMRWGWFFFPPQSLLGEFSVALSCVVSLEATGLECQCLLVGQGFA